MVSTIVSRKMDTKCLRDYKNKHRFDQAGVVSIDRDVYRVWICYQCGKGIVEEVELIE